MSVSFSFSCNWLMLAVCPGRLNFVIKLSSFVASVVRAGGVGWLRFSTRIFLIYLQRIYSAHCYCILLLYTTTMMRDDRVLTFFFCPVTRAHDSRFSFRFLFLIFMRLENVFLFVFILFIQLND